MFCYEEVLCEYFNFITQNYKRRWILKDQYLIKSIQLTFQDILFFKKMCVWYVCMWICVPDCRCVEAWRQKIIPWSCSPLDHVVLRANSDPQEQYMLFTAEPPFQTHHQDTREWSAFSPGAVAVKIWGRAQFGAALLAYRKKLAALSFLIKAHTE